MPERNHVYSSLGPTSWFKGPLLVVKPLFFWPLSGEWYLGLSTVFQGWLLKKLVTPSLFRFLSPTLSWCFAEAVPEMAGHQPAKHALVRNMEDSGAKTHLALCLQPAVLRDETNPRAALTFSKWSQVQLSQLGWWHW